MSGQVYALLGSPALVRNETNRILDKVVPDRDRMILQKMTAEEGEQLLPGAILSFSMFSPNQVFVVRRFEESTPGFLEFLLSYIQGPAKDSDHTLIITGNTFPKKGPTRRLKSALKKQSMLKEFSEKKINPEQYCTKLCTDHNLKLSRNGKSILLQRVGKDLLSLENEIAKLACYSEGTISDKDIEELTATISEASVWDFADAILVKDTGKAIRLLHRMLEEGKAPHQMLGTISWKMRDLLALQESQRKRQSIPSRWMKTPEMKRRAILRTLKKHPLHADKIFSKLQKSNRLFNSARVGDRRILELLVLELCAE
ncbi:MAG: DNA polymerase III subunit delta [Deltaproteobacteria bacterium]|nr:DNA polymerase III subunit delta [Deltaproteobacteria bacterium]